MKKFLSLFLAVVMLILVFAGCNRGKQENNDGADQNGSGDAVELSDEEQRLLYFDAAEKTLGINFLRYECFLTCTLTSPSGNRTSTGSAQISAINKGTNSARYSASFVNDQSVIEYYYANGIAYSNENGSFVAKMDEDDFTAFVDRQMFLAVGDEFNTVSAVPGGDGNYKISLEGMNAVPDGLARLFCKNGMTDIEITDFTGVASVNSNGYLTEQSITIKMSMKDADEVITAEYSAEVDFENIGQRFAIALPIDRENVVVGHIGAPVMLQNAYENIIEHSYSASYRSFYSYVNDKNDRNYSIEMNYSAETSRDYDSFKANDKTVVDYNNVSGSRTVERSSEYKDGVHTNTSGKSVTTDEITDMSAQNMYYHMLLDYMPKMDDIKSITMQDMGRYYEISYEYTDQGALALCQTVLTTVIDDQTGTAVLAEDYSFTAVNGTVKINKNMETLMSHEIHVSAKINDDGESFTVGFEHLLEIEII